MAGIGWRFRPGSPWPDRPGAFGAWHSVWEPQRRWSVDGTAARLVAAVRSACPAVPHADALVCRPRVASTSGRAHPHTLPERTDPINRRQANGSRGGRPPVFDADLSTERDTAERGFAPLKQWRSIATRYDKHALSYLGGVTLAAIVLNHRIRIQQTRPRR